MESSVDIVDNVASVTCAWQECGKTFTRDASAVARAVKKGQRKFFCSTGCSQSEARSRMSYFRITPRDVRTFYNR